LEDIAQKANLRISLSAFPIDGFVKQNNQSIQCNISVNGQSQNVKFKQNKNLHFDFKNVNSIKGKITCNQKVLIDQKLDYVLKDLSKIKTQLHNLTGVNWTYI
jgi:hypothetical protein